MVNFFRELADEFLDALAQLRRWQTWAALGMLGLFGLLAFIVARFAFRTDSILIFLRYNASACREMSNGPIIFLFCGMIFFTFSAALTLGEFHQYLDLKRHRAHAQASGALRSSFAWAAFAIAIAIAALTFFETYCR